MPSVNFNVQWPDGEQSQYVLDDFKQHCLNALDAAAERVRERFGFYCSAASAEQEKIIYKHAQRKQTDIDGTVTITSMGTVNEHNKESLFNS